MNGSLGALLQEALADEERRLELLEARLSTLREQQQQPTPSASDSTQAIWAALATGSGRSASAPQAAPVTPTAPPPEPVAEEVKPEDAQREAAADAEDWAALASPERIASEPSATAYAAAAAAVEDEGAAPGVDPRLEAARRLLHESGQGLQELKAVLARVPGWDDAPARPAETTAAEDEEREETFWSPPGSQPRVEDDDGGEDEDEDEVEVEVEVSAPPEVPARDRPTRTRSGDPSLFALDRAFRGDAPAWDGEPAWARDLRERQERGGEVLARVEELLLELGKTIATVLEAKGEHERARGDPTALEARAERAERECEGLRRAVAERASRIARLEALVEQVMVGPVSTPAAAPRSHPALQAATPTPRGTRRGAPAPGPSEALRRTLLAQPGRSGEASRRALQALEPIAEEGDRARLRQALAAIGARHRELVEEHAALLDRLVRLLES